MKQNSQLKNQQRTKILQLIWPYQKIHFYLIILINYKLNQFYHLTDFEPIGQNNRTKLIIIISVSIIKILVDNNLVGKITLFCQRIDINLGYLFILLFIK